MTQIRTLGPEGSYSSIITKRINSYMDFELVYKNTISDVITSVMDDGYGVVPINNSYGGVVVESLEKIHENKNSIGIIGFTKLKIEHCLISRNNELDISEIKKVYSHPQALKQCKGFFEGKDIERVSANSTSEKVNDIKFGEGIIASRELAVKNGLNIIDDKVGPSNNYTRFALISNKDNKSKLSDNQLLGLDNRNSIGVFSNINMVFFFIMKLLENGTKYEDIVYSLPNGNGDNDYLAVIDKEIGNLNPLSLEIILV